MKILHVITGLGTGGAERTLYNLLAGGLENDFHCEVLSLLNEGTYGERIRALGVVVHTLGMQRGLPSFGSIRRIRRLVSAFRPTLIQGWMYHGNVAASVASWRAAERPALAWNVRHSLYDISFEKPMTRQVIRANRALSKGPDAIIYNSHLALEQHQAFGFASRGSRVIPNGFDLGVFRPDADTRRAQRDAFHFPPEALVVGHVARFHPQKDHSSFLHAAVGIARKHPDVRFVLAGRGVDRDNLALTGLVPTDLQPRFIFLGERSDVNLILQAMDVLCMSSCEGEAFPNVLGEAMACGVPCVATDLAESRLIVGDTGIVVPPRNPEALAEGLMSILSRPVEQRRALGHAARERVVRNFDLSNMIDEYNTLYRSLLGARERRDRQAEPGSR